MRNEFKVTRKLYLSWGLENALKGAQLVLAIVWVLLFLVILVLDISCGGLFLYRFLLLFCIYRAFFRWLVITNKQYQMLSRNYQTTDWVRKITFEEDKIRLEEVSVSVEYEYSDIVEIKEKGNKIWLKALNKTVIRLYKDCFVDFAWEECKALIEERRTQGKTDTEDVEEYK